MVTHRGTRRRQAGNLSARPRIEPATSLRAPGPRQPRMRQEPHRLVFVDETATTTKMTRLRGRARRGTRLRARAPFGHWGTQTFIAALRHDGLTAPWLIDRPMNRAIFETWVETQLAPTLEPGQFAFAWRDELHAFTAEARNGMIASTISPPRSS